MGKWTIKVRAGWWENNLGEYTVSRLYHRGIDQKLSCPWIACVWKWSMHPKWATWIWRWGLKEIHPDLSQIRTSTHQAMVSARLTVQGEMIGRNFPSPEVAERSLEQYSTAVLEHTLAPPPLPKAEFRAAVQEPMGEGKKVGWSRDQGPWNQKEVGKNAGKSHDLICHGSSKLGKSEVTWDTDTPGRCPVRSWQTFRPNTTKTRCSRVTLTVTYLIYIYILYICISPFSDTPHYHYRGIYLHYIPLYPFYIDIKTLSAMSAI